MHVVLHKLLSLERTTEAMKKRLPTGPNHEQSGESLLHLHCLTAYLTTGHSEHLVERSDGSPLMELHQVVQAAVTLVLPDDDALSVI